MADSCLKQYRLLERIGEGGMGAVYKATLACTANVALKILSEGDAASPAPADLLQLRRAAPLHRGDRGAATLAGPRSAVLNGHVPPSPVP